MLVCVCACVHVFALKYIYTHTHTYIHTQTQTQTQTHTCAPQISDFGLSRVIAADCPSLTRTHTYTYTHKHKHTLAHPRFRILACQGSLQQTAPSLKRTPLAPSHICLRSCCPKVTKKTYESNGNRVRL